MRTNNSDKILREALMNAALPRQKYNFPLLHDTEVLTGQDADRQPSDTGNEMVPLTDKE